MAGLFYRILFGGLLACAGLLSMILGIVLYRKWWLPGISFQELGSEGRVINFMGILTVLCLVLAGFIRRAGRKNS